jgi:hypothetical protein
MVDRVIERVHKAGPSGSINRIILTLYATNGATQVAGGTDTLDFDLSSAAVHGLRSGETLTPRSACVPQCAQSSSTEYAGTVSISGSTVSLTPKTTAAWSANATVAASALVIPFGVKVVCDVT